MPGVGPGGAFTPWSNKPFRFGTADTEGAADVSSGFTAEPLGKTVKPDALGSSTFGFGAKRMGIFGLNGACGLTPDLLSVGSLPDIPSISTPLFILLKVPQEVYLPSTMLND